MTSPDQLHKTPGKHHEARRGEYRTISDKLLQIACSGIPRVMFLKEALRTLADHSGCDVMRVVLFERGRRYRCFAASNPNLPFRFDQAPATSNAQNRSLWSSPGSPVMEQLCSDLSANRPNPSLQCFTSSGSFWTAKYPTEVMPGLETSSDNSTLGIAVHSDCRSMALIPFQTSDDCRGMLQIESFADGFFDARTVEYYEIVVQTLAMSLVHRRLQVALRERMKELTCLYGIAKLAAQPSANLDFILRNAVELLPPAWLYPEVTAARIVLDGTVYSSTGFMKTVQSMRADIIVRDVQRGFVEVGYIWEKPQVDEGPFLSEERSLIDTIAHELSIIVEQRQAESEKQKLQEQLQHADRLATIGQFVACLAHEINEPLVNVLGFAQLAARSPELTEQTRNDIGKIVSASLHTREVIRMLLAYARRSDVEPTSLNLNEVVKEGIGFLSPRIDKARIELVSNLSANLPEIKGDKLQLLQVVVNLAVNSLQAMPSGGKLTISTALIGQSVVLSVADTGAGMSADVIEQAFDQFFTTKEVGQGTGLGLSIVHSIVESYGGSIEVRSNVGRGSEFTVRLPLGRLEDR